MNSAIRIALLAQMLGETPDQVPFKFRDQINIKVGKANDYAMELDRYVTREEQAFYRFEQILIENKLLPRSAQEDTAILPSLRLMVSDSRSEKTFPLDKLAIRLPNVVQEFGPAGMTYQ